jgi:hypothetical protein
MAGSALLHSAAGSNDGGSGDQSTFVAYFLTFEATATGDSQFQPVNAPEQFSRLDARLKGTAITRYRTVAGRLVYHDTRYLTLEVKDDLETYTITHYRDGMCAHHQSTRVADMGSYVGAYVQVAPTRGAELALLHNPPERRDDGWVLRYPLSGLAAMRFDETFVSELLQRTTSLASCAVQISRSRPNHSVLTYLAGRPEIREMRSDSADGSSFSLTADWRDRFGVGSSHVHWRARAWRLGACGSHAAPLQDGDAIVTHEDVDVDAGATDITPEGNTTLTVSVTCDHVAIEHAKVKIASRAQDESGHHIHYGNRPRGRLDNKELDDATESITATTDAKGIAQVTFHPPQQNAASHNVGLAGIYDIVVTPDRFPGQEARTAIAVAYHNLVPMPQTGDYHLVRGGTDTHPDAFWATPGTVQGFAQVASDFFALQQRHNNELTACNKPPWDIYRMSFNDIALPDGGLFDWQGFWRPPHQTHGKGQGGDVNHFFVNKTVEECDGTRVNLDDWLMGNMYEVGAEYGHWDRYDLGLNPQMLHLHIED